MKTIVIGFASLLISALACGPAAAWSHANRYGGSTSHSEGSTSHSNAYGGSTSHTYGEGTSHTNEYGGSTSHAYGSGSTTHTGAYGGSATHYYGGGTTVYHSAYHQPTTVNVYGSSCGNCGGWSTGEAAAAGAAVGLAAGVAIGSANANANNANAYSAGYAAGATNTAYAMGAIYPTLPGGCTSPNVGGTTYYLCSNTWFLPSYGANGVYYRVVPTP